MTELLCEPETQTMPSTLAALSLRSRMTALLDSDTIDLTAVSEAIRREPGFSQFVLQISESLALAPGAPLGTVEEAAIVLGKNRLFVTWRAWTQMNMPQPDLRRRNAGFLQAAHGAHEGPIASSDASPEVLYLSSFFRLLGFRSSPEKAAPQLFAAFPPSLAAQRIAASDEIAPLTELLMRDLISLIPYVEPVLLNAQPKPPPDTFMPARKESEE
jgi:hypothetical protein